MTFKPSETCDANKPYDLQISLKQVNVAQCSIQALAIDLGNPTRIFKRPTLLLSSTKVRFVEAPNDAVAGMIEIEFDIASLTSGVLTSITASELQIAFFGSDASAGVSENLRWAMIWAADAERKGTTRYNTSQIERHLQLIAVWLELYLIRRLAGQ